MKECEGRTWDSVCAHCVHFAQGRCLASGSEADASDSFAAICEHFVQTERVHAAAGERTGR